MQNTLRKRKSRGQNWRLRCLPLVYQIGVMKCGTSDLFYSLTSHPDVIRPPAKEPNYWNQIRYVDASVHYLFLFHHWRRLPLNKGQDFPKYGIPHIIKHLVADAKIIVILRDPVERLYSEYLYFNQGRPTSNREFHQLVEESVNLMNSCLTVNGTKSCIFNNNVIKARKSVKLVAGIYYPFLKMWTEVFQHNNVYMLTLEEYRENKTTAMRKIFKFLKLGK
ncbi:hypothetical protein LSH36_477g00054 [Paralvinella palmiformis]|uniref:Sulfotransferase domain-containing protein n=1 Tax=Paralvinella palmiformis TaxID=53620 RepID=A0AAD9J9A2_9ANNE|nr:hypothetical protein LSH36_477g00054 [Paralvinella palmiformis]